MATVGARVSCLCYTVCTTTKTCKAHGNRVASALNEECNMQVSLILIAKYGVLRGYSPLSFSFSFSFSAESTR
ncbi:hypothetical protein BU24DRAFT_245855 [Aaosphaeria arxii CBS 175.79]|uniref:Uncharacterized protein n=1 Tax=Aaosphaeria arxii CBS 175.79 TaxID=1450172 RepID=A0A6A5XLD6_9PLEO|nr:uncharacterized protein BU24DRAFT_245855 [Aaosphaeria arxii CBS 175.79]KAF2013753.1 hypothetical protein BU24DRAFT_245855 [Aaosphaeria arxii CBS 175.79]